MKKTIVAIAGLALIAAACNQVPNNNNNTGNTDNLQTYKYRPLGIEFKYPKEFQFTQPTYANLEDKVTQIEIPNSAYPETNFGDAAFTLSSSFATTTQQCDELGSRNTSGLVSKEINGVTFSESLNTEAAAGNIYDSRTFRTLHGNTCIELVETVHTGNIGNYEPGTVTEINKDEVFKRLDDILMSFKFK